MSNQETTEPQTVEDWVAELSNYQGDTIGHKIAHRAKVIERLQRQAWEQGLANAKRIAISFDAGEFKDGYAIAESIQSVIDSSMEASCQKKQ